MKTPRELLLARHRHAGPQLDALRHAALAQLPRASAPAGSFADWLRGWLWPHPRAWAGLGAAWVVALLLNHAAAPEPRAPAVASPALLASVQWQRQEVRALLDLPALPAPPPRASSPKPHSQLIPTHAHA